MAVRTFRRTNAYQVGGGSDPVSVLWAAMRDMLGNGPGPEDGIEDAWRQSKAAGIARVAVLLDRAAHEFDPGMAQSTLARWERRLGVPRQRYDAARRRALRTAAQLHIDATIPGLGAAIAEIDSNITCAMRDPVTTIATRFGKTLADRNGDTYGRSGTAVPNYSGSFVLQVTWPGAWDPERRARLARLLNRRLPSWVNWVLCNTTGFVLGTAQLGITALSD